MQKQVLAGAKRLARWLEERRMTDRAFADRLGVSQPTVSRWASGSIVPSWQHMERIAVETGGAVRPDDWLSDDARTRLNEGAG
jgi:transcriptional regulator with XRE-family HTH domain